MAGSRINQLLGETDRGESCLMCSDELTDSYRSLIDA